jgi:outer membrane protein TolC
MKTLRTLFLVLITSTLTYSQTTRVTKTSHYSIEEELVQLALRNNTAGKIAVYNSEIAEKNVRLDKMAWFDRVKLQGNLNEFTLDPERYSRSQFFPRYNFSVQLSLGDFSIIPTQVRRRRYELEITRLEEEGQKVQMRHEVLRRYNHYLSIKSQLAVQRKLEGEIGLNLEVAKDKFSKGQVDYEALTMLTENHFNQQLKIIEMEEALRTAVLDIEELIGVKLDTVLTGN